MWLRGPLVARTVDGPFCCLIYGAQATNDFFRGPPIGLRAQGPSYLVRNLDITLLFAHAEGFSKQKGTI